MTALLLRSGADISAADQVIETQTYTTTTTTTTIIIIIITSHVRLINNLFLFCLFEDPGSCAGRYPEAVG